LELKTVLGLPILQIERLQNLAVIMVEYRYCQRSHPKKGANKERNGSNIDTDEISKKGFDATTIDGVTMQ